MQSSDYLELINGYKTPLSRKEALFQAIFLIKKGYYESAHIIIDSYQLKKGELLFFNLNDFEYTNYENYLNNKRPN